MFYEKEVANLLECHIYKAFPLSKFNILIIFRMLGIPSNCLTKNTIILCQQLSD